MSRFRPTHRTTSRFGRIRPHVLRRDGVLEAPGEIPRRSPVNLALAAGWRPVA